MSINKLGFKERRDVLFDDLSQRITTILDHPVDHIEPEPEIDKMDKWGERELAIAVWLLNYLFPTSNPSDTVARAICLARRLMPNLQSAHKIVNIAKTLNVSPQAIHQMLQRANKVGSLEASNIGEPEDDFQLPLF